MTSPGAKLRFSERRSVRIVFEADGAAQRLREPVSNWNPVPTRHVRGVEQQAALDVERTWHRGACRTEFARGALGARAFEQRQPLACHLPDIVAGAA